MSSHLDQLAHQGFSAFERKEYAAALDAFRAVLDVRPDFADVLHHAGLCLALLGHHEEGLAHIDRALAVNPGYIEALVNRALLLQELGRYDEAREAFDRAREQEGRTPGRFVAAVRTRLANGHSALADLYMEADDVDSAVTQFRAALELCPHFHDVRNRYAAALIRADRLEEAAGELNRILDGNPRFIAARLNLGLVHYRQGRLADAANEWRRCEAQHPANPQVRAFLTMLEQANGHETKH